MGRKYLGGVLSAAVGLLVLGSAGEVKAQTFQGGLRGSVQDEQGVIPGVTVILLNEATGVSRETVTNEVGEFTFPAVTPGTYTVRASVPGYKTFERTGARVATQQTVIIDMTLELGAIEEFITVTGESPLLATSDASIGTVLDAEQLQLLPSPGRNSFLMSLTLPTVVTSGNTNFNRQNAQSGASTISIGGGGVRANNYLVDGFPITDLLNRAVANVSIEALEEMKIQVHTFDAEMGRTGGGVFNATARSGTNQFRGTGFYRTQPTALQEQNFFLKGTPKAEQYNHIYGYGVGGPIARNRTFFWTSLEGDKGLFGRNFAQTYPTERERRGDFSQTFDSNGNLIVIYDPLTTRTDPVTGQPIRDPFPGNVIPADRINPVGQNIASYLPAPDIDVSNRSANYFRDTPVKDAALQWSAKVDHRFSDRISLSGLYLWARTREAGDNWFDDNLFASPMFQLDRKIHVVTLNNTYILDNTTVMTVRGGYSWFDDTTSFPEFDPASLGFNSALVGGLEGLQRKFPAFNLTDTGNLGHSPRNERYYYSYGFNGTLSKLLGRHSVKIGADYRLMGVKGRAFGQSSGTFDFTRQFSQGPNPLSPAGTSGSSTADLLLGYPASGSLPLSTPYDLSSPYYAAYIQDDFRVTPSLTVNYGLRVEREDGLQETDDRFTVGFDRDLISPLNSLVSIPGRDAIRGGLLYPGVNGAPRRQGDQPGAKVGPRGGIAWSIDDRTVLRGGYGLFWAPWNYPAVGATNYGQHGFTGLTTVQQDTLRPITSIDNPFPSGLVQPAGNSGGLLTGVGGDIDFVDQNKGASRVQQFAIDLQRELPGNLAVSIGYVGARGDNLSLGGTSDAALNINQLPPELMSMGNALVERVPNPFFGVPEAGALASLATIERGQLLRPYPHFRNVNARQVSEGLSRYHAVVTEVNKRLSGWWGARLSYTWSQLKDNQFGQSNFYAPTGNILNSYDLDREYGYSLIDVPHRLVIAPIVRLPFAEDSGLASLLFGGWTLSATAMFESGFPIAVTQSPNNSGLFGSGQRPNVVAGVDPSMPGSITDRLSENLTDNQYLNRSAWSQAAAFTFGDAPRTDSRIRTPVRNNLDVAFNKTFRTGGQTTAEVRVEILNIMGWPKFRAMSGAFGTGAFGQILEQAGYTRITALHFRLRF